MTGMEIGLSSVIAIIVLIYLGMHVAVSLGVVSFISIWVFKGKFSLAITLLSHAASESISSYVFGVIPLFILMGLLVNLADIGKDTFKAANYFLSEITGGLGIATVIANTAFAAVTGISIASAAVFTKVAVPEMLRLGYTPRFAVGVVTGSSVLGMLIPPSLLLIVYALVAEQSVGHMFVAGIVPGLLLAGTFCLLIVSLAHFFPNRVQLPIAIKPESDQITSFDAVVLLAPLVILIGLVLGGIYGGIFTPTEAGAVGVVGAFSLAIYRGRLSRKSFWQALQQTGQITASISILIICASVYSRMISIIGLPGYLSQSIASADLGFLALILIYIALVIVMGTLVDSISIILIVVPIFLPLLANFGGIDLVWFGIITVIAAEIGLLTPPMGLSAFVVKASLDDRSISLTDIFAGTFPFVLAMIVVTLMIVAFPTLTRVFL
jgi:C4-dicarboxylate transporter, DctM subunit